MNQLPLDVRLKQSATFDTFFAADNNEAVHALKGALCGDGPQRIHLWGSASSGKTHLLQAACHLADSRGESAQYVDLDLWAQHDPQVLGALDEMDCLCLDNIECIGGRENWEQAVFHLADRMKLAGRSLLVSAGSRPDACGLVMPELVSRLGNGLVLEIRPLSDPEKVRALALLARQRGLDLPQKVAEYLVQRRGGDPARLFALLDELDRSSLAVKRKISLKMAKDLAD
ncbi:MAG: DnaA regulatory inactivator Hda [Gammaproteobacteria bacterium]|nr:MAG: DnaA regulatory inactivator Hda [Gammaproteobacteria bacterium]